ncbi:MAG: hypothetical protein WAM70_11685 [Pyrinomonadaceae bacterium]
MKYKSVFAVAFLLCAVTIAPAVPDQPFMQAARADLQTAKRELQRASANKGGHRAKAISLTNQAIAQVNQGIDYDRRHNHASPRLAGGPDQPHMTAALAALESAQNNLQRATSDKGGHRAKALDFVRAAIDQVKKGIDAAR